MNKIEIERKYILEYIKDILLQCSLKNIEVDNARYHHNSSYYDAPSIIENGILSIKDLNDKGIKKFSSKDIEVMNDIDSHINGNSGISLSVIGLTDLYKDEEEYDSTSPLLVDFIISSDVKASRHTSHYGNEFITNNRVEKEQINALDIRFLEYLYNFEHEQYDYENIDILIKKYNCIKQMANRISSSNKNLLFREVSSGNNRMLDVEKIGNVPKLVLKK